MIENKLLRAHDSALKKKVFFLNDKWPHFDILFNDILQISKKLKKNSKILSLERTNLYGGISLFAPYFFKQSFTSIDCGSDLINKRGSYNKKFVQDDRIIRVPFNLKSNYKQIINKVGQKKFDCIIVPNLLHHVFETKSLLAQCKKILKKEGQLYLFEPLLRELHQKPDDFFRFTPFSLTKILEELGFSNLKINYSGGPFTAAYYCWDQAIQYLPKKVKKKYKYFLEIKNLKKLERKYKKNLLRKHTSFPVSFSILCKNV